MRHRKVGKGQCTLALDNGISRIPGLNDTQRKILSLLNCDCCQAVIAQRIKKSRAYVNQTVKKWESEGLIRAHDIYPKEPGKRSYTKFYQLSPELKVRLNGDAVAEPFTACRVHNLRLKISIISQPGVLSTDKRTGYQKSWKMRGWTGNKYWYSGKAGMPSCTLDINPKSIVAYVDRRQHIVAKTPGEAEDIGWRALYRALDVFVEQQSRFGVTVELEHTGTVIGKPHGGFVGSDSPVMNDGVTVKHWWIDRSREAELGPGHPELETDIPEGMTRLDNLIKVSEQVDLTAMPTAMKEISAKLDPLNQNVTAVMAQLQGGRSIEQMFQNALDMMMRMMEKMSKMEDELRELKKSNG